MAWHTDFIGGKMVQHYPKDCHSHLSLCHLTTLSVIYQYGRETNSLYIKAGEK